MGHQKGLRDISVRTLCRQKKCLGENTKQFPDECVRSLYKHTSYLSTHSVVLVRERTIPTERPPPVGEVSANFWEQRCFTWSAQRIPTAVNLCFLDRSRYFFNSSSSSIDLTRLSGPRSRPPTTQKIWQRRESKPRPLYLQPETLTTRPQRRSGTSARRAYFRTIDICLKDIKGRFTHSIPVPCRAHAFPLPWGAGKVLECVFPI